MKRMFLLINGILTPPDEYGWHDRAVDWITHETDARAEKYEYFSGALTRFIGQPARIRQLGRILRDNMQYAPGDEINIVAHSNGAAIALAALSTFEDIKISTLHLIAPAVFAACEDNGINEIIYRGQVQRIYIYGSMQDHALMAATVSEKLLGWTAWLHEKFGFFYRLGYGNLGLIGPLGRSSEAMEKSEMLWNNNFGHSDWFLPANFGNTMRLITRP